MRTPSIRPASGGLAALLVLTLATGGCQVVEAKTWNLAQLHDQESRHQYRGALEGDIEYFLRHGLLGLLTPTGVRLVEKEPRAIEDPSGECLENLLELEDVSDGDPRITGRQIEWFARLAVEDPYRLSRERCTLALGRAGARLGAGVPESLERGVVAAGPEALQAALTGLVESFRRLIETTGRASATQTLDLEADCDVVRGLALDLPAARRVVRVTSDLVRAAGLDDPELEAMRRLDLEMQSLCVRRALAAALLDRDPVVRAAAVEATVACAGNAALIPILAQLPREAEPEVLMRAMRLVVKHDLPGSPADIPAPEAAQLRERWIDSIYALVVERPESEVRVAAMLALARVSDHAVASLREEDWQAWWQARHHSSSPIGSPSSGRGGTSR